MNGTRICLSLTFMAPSHFAFPHTSTRTPLQWFHHQHPWPTCIEFLFLCQSSRFGHAHSFRSRKESLISSDIDRLETKMDLEYLIQLDPIYDHICDHLRTQDLFNLGDVSTGLSTLIKSSPRTWKHLDLSGRKTDVILHLLRHDAIPGALQRLILDCSDISMMALVGILIRCPNIEALGLGGCTELLDGLISVILEARRNGFVRKLRYLGLLGAPHFKTTGMTAIAASISQELQSLGITSDLVRCTQEHAFTTSPEDHWHLAHDTKSICAACRLPVTGCYPCINSRTCRGCFRVWCFECENPITNVCYECGRSCNACKQGIYVKCLDCGSMFCKLHRESENDRYSTSQAISGRS